MVVVSVTYPASEGSRFDLNYYRTKHIPLVRERWATTGLTDLQLLRGTGVPGGGPAAYQLVALLSFESEAAFGHCLQLHGEEIMGDIKNFTDVTPVVQFNERLN